MKECHVCVNSPIDNPPLLDFLGLQRLLKGTCLGSLSPCYRHRLRLRSYCRFWSLCFNGPPTPTTLLFHGCKCFTTLLFTISLTSKVLVVLNTQVKIQWTEENNQNLVEK